MRHGKKIHDRTKMKSKMKRKKENLNHNNLKSSNYKHYDKLIDFNAQLFSKGLKSNKLNFKTW